MPIKYTETFIGKAKKAIPNSTELHSALDMGNPKVGELIFNEIKTMYDLHKQWIQEMSNHFSQKSD